eukprot:3455553-Pyramimonas_sp.AAC.1
MCSHPILAVWLPAGVGGRRQTRQQQLETGAWHQRCAPPSAQRAVPVRRDTDVKPLTIRFAQEFTEEFQVDFPPYFHGRFTDARKAPER